MKRFKNLLIIILVLTVLCACGKSVHFDYDDSSESNEPKNDNTVEPNNESNQNIIDNGITTYSLYCKVAMKIRTGPSTSYTQIGKLAKYSRVVGYDAYYNDGYTWYRIGPGEWIANDGTFLEVTERKDLEYDDKEDERYFATYRIKDDLKIMDSTSFSANNIGLLKATSFLKVFAFVTIDGVIWCQIGEHAWVPDKGGQVNFEAQY